jgi:hypothetical protein
LLRGLSSDRLHQEMVNQQYKLGQWYEWTTHLWHSVRGSNSYSIHCSGFVSNIKITNKLGERKWQKKLKT